jgi:hypothetical protein
MGVKPLAELSWGWLFLQVVRTRLVEAAVVSTSFKYSMQTHHSLYKKVIKFNFFIIKIIGL